jgi:hypothetical protein
LKKPRLYNIVGTALYATRRQADGYQYAIALAEKLNIQLLAENFIAKNSATSCTLKEKTIN